LLSTIAIAYKSGPRLKTFAAIWQRCDNPTALPAARMTPHWFRLQAMNLKHGQRFEFDERFAVVEFSTAASARVSVYEQRLVPFGSRVLPGRVANPHVGWIDFHYPTDGGRPAFANMELQPDFCTLDYAQALYLLLAEMMGIPCDTPFEIRVTPKTSEGLGILGGVSRFPEFPCYHNKDSFEAPMHGDQEPHSAGRPG
jgi:hypothetical protein